MIFYFNGEGTLIKANPTAVYQGSNKASTIYFVAPFAASNEVFANFILPNGDYYKMPKRLSPTGAIDGVKLDGDEQDFAVWLMVLDSSLTKYHGNLTAQFTVYNADTEETNYVTTEAVNITISKGTPKPSVPITDTIYDELAAGLSAVTGRVVNLENWKELLDGKSVVYTNDANGKATPVAYSEYSTAGTFVKRATSGGAIRTGRAVLGSDAVPLSQVNEIVAGSLDIANDLGQSTVKAASQKLLTDNVNSLNNKINSLTSGVYKYKGSVPTYDDLPTTNLTVGDVYNTEDTGMNYAWTETAWDALGASFSIDTITIAEIDELFSEPVAFTLNISCHPFVSSQSPVYIALDSNVADASHWDYRVVSGNQIEKKDGTTVEAQLTETVTARMIAFSNVQGIMIVHSDDTEISDVSSPYMLQQNDREIFITSYKVSTNAAIEEQPIV